MIGNQLPYLGEAPKVTPFTLKRRLYHGPGAFLVAQQ